MNIEPLSIRRVTTVPEYILQSRWPCSVRGNTLVDTDVSDIVRSVREMGDKAIIQYTKKFDGLDISDRIRVSDEEIANAYASVDQNAIDAIRESKKRLARHCSVGLERLQYGVSIEGVGIRNAIAPLRSVGCYIPGGSASYPSSVVMAVVPAVVAGVQRVVICTPPGLGGTINPLTLVASDICGATEIYRVGGAQAISALAYGSQSISPVDKIVGPGNRYVTAAKRLVSIDVPVDMPAGPSELLVIADKSANPRLVALDLISQAEHDQDAKAILVTDSASLADGVISFLQDIIPSLPRSETILQSLNENGLVYVCPSLIEGFEFVNQYAPEHVEIMTVNARLDADKITTAGLVLVGGYSPVAASDYCLGVNHVLPTGGYGNAYSQLSISDFIRTYSVVECSKEGLRKVSERVKVLSECEGLPGHGSATDGRFTK
ncbi:MAG: bifunctional histidinal dehydrogenase and histidinol dehydrogenase [Candidatus Thorarchaeota archaeon]|nr:MAG: bifunctional histidinal dehydrogenase and histidinol dehydrogenase [Candidatus Thorarchaeota archaeon]